MSVEWLCKRCATKLKKSIESEPMILRRCTGCDVENYCYPSGHVGEDAEPEKAAKIARSQAAVHGKTEAEREVAESIPFKIEPKIKMTITPEVVEDEVQSEDAEIPEEVVPAEQPTDGAPDNVTGATDPYADLSKEDLLERIKALEAEENQT